MKRPMLSAVIVLLPLFSLSAETLGQVVPPSPIEQCALALQQDMYSYASSMSLKEDFMRTISEDTWKKMSKDLDMWGSYFEVIKGGLSYKEFDDNRRKYFESVRYTP